ncbi:DUF1414 domain-containing protein [Catenovulum sp. SM1970]|uniref:DUF1414 domain-containing protein n=1 Tax=Marinifaba aquimaris TaxID=2741323 RepID=UPI0015726BDB|nr:DUF1414 domain-containing protein [Marinifaba aquimaris]NTS78713.1 DUF1414 domain-containing protein [Marinifaba aquimaris]
MPQSSKYSEQEFEKIFNAINIALDAQDTPTDLALMALGETIINRINKAYAVESREKVLEQFCLALKQSSQP